MADTGLSGAVHDVDGNTSSKRVAGFIALALFAAAGVVDSFTSHHVPEHFLDDLMIIIVGCFGFAVAERFAPKGS